MLLYAYYSVIDWGFINSSIVARLLNLIRDVDGSIHCLECEREVIYKILANACSMIVLVCKVMCCLEKPKQTVQASPLLPLLLYSNQTLTDVSCEKISGN